MSPIPLLFYTFMIKAMADDEPVKELPNETIYATSEDEARKALQMSLEHRLGEKLASCFYFELLTFGLDNPKNDTSAPTL